MTIPRRCIKLVLVGTIILLLAALALAWVNACETAARDRRYETKTLNEIELAEIDELFALKREVGGQAWPGFGSAIIPLVWYNDRYEFLRGYPGKPQAWQRIDSVTQTYYRRLAKDPQSFARRIEGRWVGSIAALDTMNRDMLLSVRKHLPQPIASLFPYAWVTFESDMHAVLCLHEMFHAYQAQENPVRFARSQTLYAIESDYPYEAAGFAAAWSSEGSKLRAAMDASDQGDLLQLTGEFLELRRARREHFDLNPAQIAFETEMEWLEGLAKYLEMRLHEIAAAEQRSFGAIKYAPGLHHWWDELRRLESSLGEQRGQFRFYLSGMAQARLLDRLLPNWKPRAMADACLDALLAEALED